MKSCRVMHRPCSLGKPLRTSTYSSLLEASSIFQQRTTHLPTCWSNKFFHPYIIEHHCTHSALQHMPLTIAHPHSHSYTGGRGCHTGCHQGQLGLSILLKETLTESYTLIHWCSPPMGTQTNQTKGAVNWSKGDLNWTKPNQKQGALNQTHPARSSQS